MKIENNNMINIGNTDIYHKKQKIQIQKNTETFKEEKEADKNYKKEDLEKNIEKLNKEFKNTTCEFAIHDQTNHTMIRILDKTTKKIIREFPAEDTLDKLAKGLELAGIILDRKL